MALTSEQYVSCYLPTLRSPILFLLNSTEAVLTKRIREFLPCPTQAPIQEWGKHNGKCKQ